jgi:hypothetical protein
MVTIGKALCKACSIVNEDISVELLSAYELKVSDQNVKPDSVKIRGQLIIKGSSDYTMSHSAMVLSLKKIVQEVIFQDTIKQVQGFPSWVPAFLFEINAVNHPHQIICGLILVGINANWYDKLDHLGMNEVTKEIANAVPFDEEGNLPVQFRDSHSRDRSIGVMQYLSRKAMVGGQMGKCLALVYAKTDDGEEAARALNVAFANGKVIHILGGLPITIFFFPNPKKNNGLRNKSTVLKQIDTFAKDCIKSNTEQCKNYITFHIDNVTSSVFDERALTNATANCDLIRSIVPKCVKGSTNSGSPLKFAALIICVKNGNTCTKSVNYFITIIKNQVLGFLQPKSTARKEHTSMHKAVENLGAALKSIEGDSDNWYLIIWGRGGNRCAGPVKNWSGPDGAKFLTQGVSGSLVLSFPTQNQCWARFVLSHSGIDTWEKLREFRMGVPHNEDNLSPTWPKFDGPIFHRPNAVAYTYCEHDDQEMLLSRMKMTKIFTGKDDGRINRPEFRDFYGDFDGSHTAQLLGGGNTKMNEDSPFEEVPTDEPNDEEHFSNSQEYEMGPCDGNDEENDSCNNDILKTPPKKRKVDSFASANPNHTPKPPVLKFFLALPDIASLEDCMQYLHLFRPGFGQSFIGQSRLCRFEHFVNCNSLVVDCSDIATTDALLTFSDSHLMFGKYQCASCVLTDPKHLKLLDTQVLACPKLEKMAKHHLVQHVKHSTPVQFDHLINKLIMELDSAEDLLFHYMKHWKIEGSEDLIHEKRAAEVVKIPEVIIETVINETSLEDFEEAHERTFQRCA